MKDAGSSPLGPPELIPRELTPYEQWTWEHTSRVLSLNCEPGLVVCWGRPVPAEARAAVVLPRDTAFLERPEILRRYCTAAPATEGLTVQGGEVPTVRLDVDILSWIGWFVSRAEEYEPVGRDEHGRFPRSASLAEKMGLGERPVADLLAMHLRGALERAAEKAGLKTWRRHHWPEGKRFAVALTHDVDHAMYRDVVYAAKLLAGAGASAVLGRLARARRRMAWAAGLARGGRHSPDWQFETFVEAERRRGFRSAFYLLPYESTLVEEAGSVRRYYDVRQARIVDLFRQFAADGWEIGHHYSYHAHDRSDGLATEWKRLGNLLGPAVRMAGGRSHCLRFRVPDTWAQVAACGIQYDATLGWSEGSGFRSGTLWPYQPFGRRASRIFPTWELGLHLMDTYFPTLDALAEKVRQVCDQAAEVGGCACLLIHPTPPRHAEATVSDFAHAYEAILDDLAAREDAWVATPRAVVGRLAASGTET